MTRKVTVGMTLVTREVERDMTATFHCYPGQRATRWEPGEPPYAELDRAWWDDSGDDLTDDEIAAISAREWDRLELAALDAAAEAERDAQEAAAAMREDYYDDVRRGLV